MAKSLKRNIDNILDVIYSPTGAQPETIESVCSAFHLINKVGVEIGRRQMSTTVMRSHCAGRALNKQKQRRCWQV